MVYNDVYQKVIEDYKKTGSVKKTSQNVGTTLVRAQRILITEGLWSSPTSEIVVSLYSKGKTVAEIAEELFISEKTVQAYLPYTRKEKGYGGNDRTTDAIKSDDYRKRMHNAALSQVSKANMKMEQVHMTNEDKNKVIKFSSLQNENKKGEIEASLKEDNSEFTTEQLYASHMRKYPEVLKLNLSLDLKYLDGDDMDVLRKYSKVDQGVIREILVPADITLHALSYVILRAFGWQNSHLHKFYLPKDVFQMLTGGKNTVDKYNLVKYDGKFADWVKLCGLIFRYPCEDFDDLYWDDDYIEGHSFKTWLRKKYTGPYRYKGEWEHYKEANFAAYEDLIKYSLENKSIHDLQFEYQGGLDELLERIPLIELLIPRGIKKDPEIKEKINCLQKRQAEEMIDLSVIPVTHELFYSYDYGDGWKVRITLEDCYYTKLKSAEALERSHEEQINNLVVDRRGLSDILAFDMNNNMLGKAMSLKVATVVTKRRPVGLLVDGLNLMDDVGGIQGYVDFLKVIHGKDNTQKEDLKEWAKWMGWTGRMVKPENLL